MIQIIRTFLGSRSEDLCLTARDILLEQNFEVKATSWVTTYDSYYWQAPYASLHRFDTWDEGVALKKAFQEASGKTDFTYFNTYVAIKFRKDTFNPLAISGSDYFYTDKVGNLFSAHSGPYPTTHADLGKFLVGKVEEVAGYKTEDTKNNGNIRLRLNEISYLILSYVDRYNSYKFGKMDNADTDYLVFKICYDWLN